MKKLFLIAFVLMTLPGLCRTLLVGKGQNYATIRSAVSAAQEGDTILVKQGTYYINNIVITKSICLIGENYPVLHGANQYEIFTVSGKDITIKGFHFTNSGYSAMNDYASVKIIDAIPKNMRNSKFQLSNNNYYSLIFTSYLT